ncbi:hypothetical protein J2W35_000277 [Variovorax boronicumulans]|uniref:hypothetical protein n=1 Tax=Variovorax boronicumulans TaxID=436515 RepID=UPI00277EDFAC|nr:hypothetical protein [Variovorax boronicumulans]MDQ0079949.1 hypothetical protein [Variovorax boronicumulans]
MAILRAVTSKTGVIGIGLPLKSLRRKPQSPRRVCGFVVRASSFGGSMGGREQRRIETADTTMQSLRVALSEDGTR